MPCRLNSGSATASTAAISAGRYSASQPASTALIAMRSTVAAKSHTHAHVRHIEDLNKNLVDEIEYFFISYNTIKGKQFKPLGRFGTQEAVKLVHQGIKSFRRKHQRSRTTKKRARPKQ